MTAPGIASVQLLTRPLIAWVLAQYGCDVLLRRPGQPGVPLRAVLMPWSDEGKEGPDPADLQVRSSAWFCLLDHAAPAHDLGFTITEVRTGRVFVPDAYAEDIGNAQVGFALRVHPLVERTRLSTLTFTVPGSGTVTLPNGNVRPAPGVPVTVEARLSVSTDPRIAQSVGADNAETVLIGRWGSLAAPTGKPPGVRWGATSPLVYDGQPGVFTLKLAWPDEDLATETQFGSRFVGVWKAASPQGV